MIGKGGAMLKRIGTAARRELRRSSASGVPRVTVCSATNWREDERALREFGFRLTS